MFRHYLNTALRNFIRNKFYTTISVVGLALGLASVFLIIQYLKLELSYDRLHTNAENIYRIAWISTNPQTRTRTRWHKQWCRIFQKWKVR